MTKEKATTSDVSGALSRCSRTKVRDPDIHTEKRHYQHRADPPSPSTLAPRTSPIASRSGHENLIAAANVADRVRLVELGLALIGPREVAGRAGHSSLYTALKASIEMSQRKFVAAA